MSCELGKFVTNKFDSFAVDTNYLEEKETRAGDNLFLHEMCNPRPFGPDCQSVPVTVVYFNLPKLVNDILEIVPKYQNFQLYSVYLKAAAKGFRGDDRQRVLSLEEFVTHVWNPCMTYCIKICRSIQDGSITLRNVDGLLRTVPVRLQEEIRDICIMNRVGGDPSWIDSRFKQFAQFKKMKSAETAAQTVLQLAQTYGLSGDFNFLEKLLESVSHVVPLKFFLFISLLKYILIL